MQSRLLHRPDDETITLLKAGNDLIVAGYASVELVDKQGDLITGNALKDGFRKFMEDPKYRNVQLAHSNIQVGEVVPSYTDSEGRLWKSEVDDVGMFVVVQLRDDIEKAKEVAAEIRKGNLRGFSIGGQAFKRVRKSDPKRGDYQEISKLELHEITICEKGINPEATFRILKEDKEKVKKMTEEDVMNQMGSVLERLESRLETMEKASAPAEETLEKKYDMKMDGKDDKKEDKKDKDKDMTGKSDDVAEDGVEKSEYSDVITAEYLNWMEDTLKSAGVDTGAARDHFEKANLGSTPKELEAYATQRHGQTKNREQEGGKPSANPAKVTKSEYLAPSDVSEADIEAAYEVYKAAALEEEFRGSLETDFSTRYAAEREQEIAKAEAQAFDARSPLASIEKSLATLSERIDSIAAPVEAGETIVKSDAASVDVPSTEDMARMSWDEVHQLAGRVFEGGN